MTLYEILKIFKSTEEDSFHVVVKGAESKKLFENRINFYRMQQAITYHESDEDIMLDSYSDKTVLNVDLFHTVITIENWKISNKYIKRR